MRREQTPSGGVRQQQAGILTGNGSQVQVVPDHLLEFVVQGALLKLQAEVVTQISVQHLTCREEENSGSVQQNQSVSTTLQTHQSMNQLLFTPFKTGIQFQMHIHKHILI